MSTNPVSRPQWLVPTTQRSFWDTAIRIAPGVDPAPALARLTSRLLALASQVHGHVFLHLEPTGDACDTGHWVDIEIDHGTIWADMTPWPDRHGGAIPPRIADELADAGWIAVNDSTSPGPTQRRHGPIWRLVAGAGEDGVRVWAKLVTHAVRRVIDPDSQRWYLYAVARVPCVLSLVDALSGPTGFDDEWSVDLGGMLDVNEWEQAVWRSDTEAGAICCRLGLHQYHEPPCPPPAWNTHNTERGDPGADLDL